MKKENIQMIKMCMQTYINLYGAVPGIPEMVDWTGLTYEEVLPAYKAEIMPKTSGQAA